MISEHRLPTETRFLMACLWGGQLADCEERSDECHNLCFGLELLIQPFSLAGMVRCVSDRHRVQSCVLTRQVPGLSHFD